MSGGRYLTHQQLENLKNYKYAASTWSFIDKQLAAYWEFCVTLLPIWIAPNLVTFSGFLMMVLNYGLVAHYSSNFSQNDIPNWVWYFSIAALWIYQTLDAIDGKQARRTGSSSPLGQLFDHGCDALTTTIVACNVHAAMGFQGHWVVLVHSLHVGPFFVSNWEEFQTGVMRFGAIGVTEGELTHMLLYLITAIFGPSVWAIRLPFIEVELRYFLAGALGVGFTFTTLEALTVVYYDAKKHNKDLQEGIQQFLQFISFVFFFLVWTFGPQSAIAVHPRFYLLSYGITFGYLISSLIIFHCTQTPFTRFPKILWPLPFVALNSWISFIPQEGVIITVYLLFVVGMYLHFVVNIIDEVTTFLGISCFTITPKPQAPPSNMAGASKATVDVTAAAKNGLKQN